MLRTLFKRNSHLHENRLFGITGRSVVLSVLLTCAAAPALLAAASIEIPGTWTRVSTTGPSARFGSAMVYDRNQHITVLFGGANFHGRRFGDTWAWNGTSWRLLTRSGPSGRAYAGITDDFNSRNRIVLFGGVGTSTNINQDNGDTWEWDGQSWTQVATTGPSPRNALCLAYDAIRQRVVLFGGAHVFVAVGLNDTWEWDGSSWTQVTPAGNSPRGRLDCGMDFDIKHKRTTLFGGAVTGYNDLGDTWQWNGTNWKKKATTGPSPRFSFTMTYDTARQVMVLFGGVASTSGVVSDTWEWDGATWTEVATTGPTARAAAAMAYDHRRGKAVLFGGTPGGFNVIGDTWEWVGPIYTCPSRAPGDLNCDGQVDHHDVTILQSAVDNPALSSTDPRDLDHDNRVTAADVKVLRSLCTYPACALK